MATPRAICSIDPCTMRLRMNVCEVNQSTYIKLRWHDRTPILLMSAHQYIAYKPSYDVYGNISITLAERGCQQELLVVKRIEDSIRSHKRIIDFTQGKTFIPSVYHESKYWKLRSKTSDVYWFDRNNMPVHDTSFIKSLIPPYCVRVIVKMDSVWITRFCFGFTFVLHQVQIYDDGYYLNKSLFQDTDPHAPDAALERFTKMLKVGIPQMAVRMKMILEGFSEDVISRVVNNEQKSHFAIPAPPPPPPKLPPPPPPILGNSKLSAIFKDIAQKNFTLKKVSDEPVKSKQPKDDRQFQVSLNDLLCARNKLKPLEKVYHSHYVPLQALE